MFLQSALASSKISTDTLEQELLLFKEFPQYQPVLQLINTTLKQRVSNPEASQPHAGDLRLTLQNILGCDLSEMEVDDEWDRDHAEHLLQEVKTYFEKFVSDAFSVMVPN